MRALELVQKILAEVQVHGNLDIYAENAMKGEAAEAYGEIYAKPMCVTTNRDKIEIYSEEL